MESKSDLWTIILIMFGLLICLVLINQQATINHENAHKQIAIYYGCVNYTTEIKLFGTSTFTCWNKHNESDSEKTVHSFNEIVSYNNDQLTLSMFACTGMLICALYFFRQK